MNRYLLALVLLLAGSLPAVADTFGLTMSQLRNNCKPSKLYGVIDAQTGPGDCPGKNGGGSVAVTCQCNNAGNGYVGLEAGSAPAFSVITTGTNTGAAMTWGAGSSLDAGAADSTNPCKEGTTPPATCGVGECFFDTDATAGSNLFGCTATDTWTLQSGGGGGAPVGADYLVGTADATLTNEIIVGTSPGGELGGSWASPTVDATHSGSAHHAQSHALDGGDHTLAGATDGHTLQATGAATFLFGWVRVRGSADCTAETGGKADEVCWDRTGNTAYYCEPSAGDCDTAGEWQAATAAGDGVGYDEVLDEGTGVTKRAQVNFIGAGVSCVDNAGQTRTDCTITGGGSKPDWLKSWRAPSTSSIGEPGDNFAPLAVDAGANVDVEVALYDAATDECRSVAFRVPSDIDTGGTCTFTAEWYSGTETTGDVVWDFRHNSGTGEGVSWDTTRTIEAAAADTTQGTVDQKTVTTWTETVTNLGWTASEFVEGLVCRDANNGGDTMANDASMLLFSVRCPRA